MNVDIDSDEVRSVDRDEVRDGYGNDNPKTKKMNTDTDQDEYVFHLGRPTADEHLTASGQSGKTGRTSRMGMPNRLGSVSLLRTLFQFMDGRAGSVRGLSRSKQRGISDIACGITIASKRGKLTAARSHSKCEK